MKEYMTIMIDGQMEKVEIVDILTVSGNKYVVYDKGEIGPSNNHLIYISKLKQEAEGLVIHEIIDEEEYRNVFAELKKVSEEG